MEHNSFGFGQPFPLHPIEKETIKKMTVQAGEWTTVKGPYGDWTVLVDQYSNKGPIIILKNRQGDEVLRILHDTCTLHTRILPGQDSVSGKVEIVG